MPEIPKSEPFKTTATNLKNMGFAPEPVRPPTAVDLTKVHCWSCKMPTDLPEHLGGKCPHCLKMNYPDISQRPIVLRDSSRIPVKEMPLRTAKGEVFYHRENTDGTVKVFVYDTEKRTPAGSQISYALILDVPYDSIRVGERFNLVEEIEPSGKRIWVIDRVK